jgi:hypothetical protein
VTKDKLTLPQEYKDFKDVFSEEECSKLPPFRGLGLNHVINLMPDLTLPNK